MTASRDTPARISVVVASRGRPDFLARCLMALDQALWPSVEIVVVADEAGRAVVADRSNLKCIAFDAANLSAARNAGIAAAGGDIVAFIDDDAVAEPMWLAAIAHAFRDNAVGAVTGPVLGRNGISLQSAAETIRSDATTVRSGVEGGTRRAVPGQAPKTVGTNMAFRADLLRAAGGFDETFRFYLDDADLNMRLGAMGVLMAYAPLAVVHHATAASPRRRADRTPVDLAGIGHSTAAFLRRHHPAEEIAEKLADARAREHARLLRALQTGALEPRDIPRLLAGFDKGAERGREAGAPALATFGPAPAFLPRPSASARHAVVAGAGRTRRKARATAARLRAEGAIVSLFEFSYTGLYHKVRFVDGIWVQTGGLWGRSERSGPLLRWTTRRARLETETARIVNVRGLSGPIVDFLAKEGSGPTEWFPFF
ncbi:MAG: glycosyltransferase family 2 protein [Paracoccaceae bacterium]|nr:glycosyltransferase family 2 protein [Paracoccaceae bacterium]